MTAAERLEELRDLPRVTAEDRERYKRWEQEARAELAEVEPEHSQIERAYDRHRIGDWVDFRPHRTAIDHADAIRRDVWRNHWRSLPDYDGPPMRAPSGPVFVSIGSNIFEKLPDEYHEQRAGLLRQFAAMARRGELSVVSPDRSTLDGVEVPADLYGHPAAGGRGWCPKLAGVGE